MRGNLYKIGSEYRLDVGGIPYATTDNSPYKRLSKQNCDEIFGVVDVDKLATKYYKDYDNLPIVRYNSYTTGFNKAMELNKDKVFTKEDMRKAFIAGSNVFTEEDDDAYGSEFQREEDEFIQSLQQPTEIEVEIVMEECQNPKCENGTSSENGNDPILCKSCGGCGKSEIPKLDSEGCLILKKIEDGRI
jgi:hypothetical protein